MFKTLVIAIRDLVAELRADRAQRTTDVKELGADLARASAALEALRDLPVDELVRATNDLADAIKALAEIPGEPATAEIVLGQRVPE